MKKNSFLLALVIVLLFIFIPITVSAHHGGTSDWNKSWLGLYVNSNGKLIFGWHSHFRPTTPPAPAPNPTPPPAPKVVYPTSVSIKSLGKKIYVGDSIHLSALLSPSDTTVTGVTWNSSNNKIAKVSSSGTVKALKAGKVTVTVKTSNGITSKRRISIYEHKAKSVKLKRPPSKIGAGESKNLKVIISPKNTTNKTIRWKSSNSKIIKIDKKGKIKALKKGSATITAMTSNGKKTQKKIVVYATTPESIQIQGLPSGIYVGDTIHIKAKVLPSTAKNKNYKVTFSNTSMVKKSGDSNYSYTLREPGSLKVTVTASNGKKSSKTFTVVTPIPKLNLTQGTNSVVVNKESYTISGSVASRNNSYNQLDLYINGQEIIISKLNGTYSKNFTLNEGLNTFTIKAVNSYGKQTILTKNVTFIPPAPALTVIQGTNPAAVTNQSYRLSGKVTDINNYYSKLKLYINDKEAFIRDDNTYEHPMDLTDGLNRITIRAVNTYGKQTILTKDVTFNPPAPALTVIQGTNPADVTNQSYRLSGKVTDINNYYSKLKLYINDKEAFIRDDNTYEHPMDLTDGLNKITIRAVNTYGKQTILTKDVTFNPPAPALTVIQGTNPATVTNRSYRLSGKVADINNYYSKLKLYINDKEAFIRDDNTYEHPMDLTDGLNRITIRAVNTYGKQTILTKDVTFNPPAPALTLIEGTSPVTVNNQSYTFNGKVTDTNDSPDDMQLYINDKEAFIRSDGTFSQMISLAEGLNEISIIAVNTTGKQTILTKEVTFTPPVPVVTVIQGTDPVIVNNKSYSISGKVTDINASADDMQLYINDEEAFIRSDNTYSKRIDLVQGLNRITFRAVNTYGKETVLVKEVTFTPSAPAITVDQGIEPDTVNNKNYSISGTVTDINTSFSKLKLYINDKEVHINTYDGSFFETIVLTEGLNKIILQAVNMYGKETIFAKEVTFIPLVSAVIPEKDTKQNNLED